MDKSKAIKNIIIYIIILMMCMFFVGFFTGKKVYAAELDNNDIAFYEVKKICDDFQKSDLGVDYNNYEYITIYMSEEFNQLEILASHNEIKFYYSANTSNNWGLVGYTSSCTYNISVYDNNGFIMERDKYGTYAGSHDKSLEECKAFILSELRYSSNDLIDSNGEVFFLHQKMMVIPTQLRGVEMGAVMEQVVLMMMISLSSVVSLVALRKGLRALKTLLHQA